MIIPAIFFLCGNLLLFYWPGELPPAFSLWYPCAFALLLFRLRRYSFALLPLGFIWAWWHAADHLALRFPDQWVGENISIQGQVVSLPEKGPHHLRFELQCEQWQPPGHDPVSCNHRVRLNWYYPRQIPRIGERWTLTVRLKPPIGFLNPGSFDYEKWLFQQRISATGYVHNKSEQRKLAAAGFSIHTLRDDIAERLRNTLEQRAGLGGVLALTLGIRHELESSDWQRYQITGTSHLVAISGLHVGLISMLGLGLGRWLWARSHRLTCRLPAQQFGLIVALVLAAGYAALAGFAIPTQRALVMIATLAMSGLVRRETSAWHKLGMAMIAVLLWDPFAVLDVGFWLSFCAVGFIFVWLSRPQQGNRLWQGTLIATVLSLAMFPLTQLFFQSISLIAPVANAVAVPWVSFIILPLCLLGTLAIHIMPLIGDALLQLAAINMDWLNRFLEVLSQLPYSRLPLAAPSEIAIGSALLGIGWLLAPRGVPARQLGLVLLLPSFMPQAERPEQGQAQVTLLDVGQGLSLVIETRHHTLVYDTGPRFPSGFNTGEAVVLPYLRERQRTRLDRLIISHGDNDHIGGAEALNALIPVFQAYSSVPEQIDWRYSQRCRDDQRWQWDGVRFEMLHPEPGASWHDNNGSCVLKVTAGKDRLLLPGDIEARAEQALTSQQPDALAADVLVAPHHGSRTSSTAAFIEHVDPDWVLFPAARFNRYHFPAQPVVARYQERGISSMTTGRDGAITFTLGADAPQPRGYRMARPTIWRYRALE